MKLSTGHAKFRNIALGIFFICAVLTCAVFFLMQDIDILRDIVRNILETARNTHWSYPIVCFLYILSGLVMFPIIILNLVTAMVFGPLYGFIYAMSGTLLSGTLFFFLGRFGRNRGLKKLLSGPKLSSLDRKLKNSGVIGVAALRLIPIAPFGIFNMAAGITSLRYLDYIVGTFLAFWPGGIARAVVGDSLVSLFLQPSRETVLYLAAGIALWITIIIGLHFWLKKFRPAEDKIAA